MLLVDTNILLDAANPSSSFHRPSNDFLERQRQRSGAWFTTWPVVFEFLRVITHTRAFPRPWRTDQAWSFVTSLLDSPGLSVLVPTPRHADVAAEVFKEAPNLAGNIFHDAHTAILMREHGIKTIVTRDLDFHRFKFLEVIDPADA